jgi:hypothetical protein
MKISIGEELGIININRPKTIKTTKRKCLNMWKEYLKTEPRNCSVYINQRTEDTSNVRQKNGTLLIFVSATGQEPCYVMLIMMMNTDIRLLSSEMKMAVFWVVAPCSLVEFYQTHRRKNSKSHAF